MKILSLFLLMALWGCANHPTVEDIAAPNPKKPLNNETVSIETKQLAVEQKADFVTEFKFQKARHSLSTEQKRKIDQMLKLASKQSTIEEIKVISWGDQDFPSDETKKLSAEQIAVAQNRNEAIQDYIQAQNADLKIKTYSMATRANAFKEFLGTSEARIKKSLERAGISNEDTDKKFRSQASKAIVMIITQ